MGFRSPASMTLTRPKRGDEAGRRAYHIGPQASPRARRISGAPRSPGRPPLWGERAPGPIGPGARLNLGGLPALGYGIFAARCVIPPRPAPVYAARPRNPLAGSP